MIVILIPGIFLVIDNEEEKNNNQNESRCF